MFHQRFFIRNSRWIHLLNIPLLHLHICLQWSISYCHQDDCYSKSSHDRHVLILHPTKNKCFTTKSYHFFQGLLKYSSSRRRLSGAYVAFALKFRALTMLTLLIMGNCKLRQGCGCQQANGHDTFHKNRSNFLEFKRGYTQTHTKPHTEYVGIMLNSSFFSPWRGETQVSIKELLKVVAPIVLILFQNLINIWPQAAVKVKQSRYRPGVAQRVPGS
jgi:hypothetical protein